MSDKRDASTSSSRGEVAPQARERVGSDSSESLASPPHPGARMRSDPPLQGEGKGEAYWQGLMGLVVGSALVLPSLGWACTITHAPADSTDDKVVFNVRMKPGERCVIHGDGKDAPWFRSGEKMSAFSVFKGHRKRLIHELHNKHDPKRARWQYVYVSPKGWTGQDMVGISFAAPPIDNLYYIVVAP